MKNLISLFVFALILVVPAALAQTPAKPWNLYTIKDEQISIGLPVVPWLLSFTETRKPPEKDRKRNVITCSAKGVIYTIYVTENTEPKLTLETFIQEHITRYPSDNLTFERDLTLDGVPGKAFVYPDKTARVQFFANDERLYEFRADGAPVDDPRMATFFRSLSLKTQDGAIALSEDVRPGSSDTASESVITARAADTKARVFNTPQPGYNAKAKKDQIAGTVVLRCVFASDGKVTNIEVIQGLPAGLTEAAIEAARKIKFIPATKDGRNVSMWMQLEYNFNLDH
jgi:TonB family protein